MNFTRRTVLGAATTGAVGVALGGAGAALPAAAAGPRPRFPGHVPGKTYVGITGGGFDAAKDLDAPVGMRRTYYRWGDIDREMKQIAKDHAARRLPWVSFKPPGTAKATWSEIAAGEHDAAIRKRARAYAKIRKPVIVTFHHEPHNDGGKPHEFKRAWIRIHDVLRDTRDLDHIVFAPIIGEWVFNPYNRQVGPRSFLSEGVLKRTPLVGIDLYQNDSGKGYQVRLGRILKWLNRTGHPNKMVGLGETAATDDFGTPDGATWWKEQWAYARQQDRLFALNYWNGGVLKADWRLTESQSKWNAFNKTVTDKRTTRLKR